MPLVRGPVGADFEDGRPFFVVGDYPGSGTDAEGRPYFTIGEGGAGYDEFGCPYFEAPYVSFITIPTPFEDILLSGNLHLRHKLRRSNVAGEVFEGFEPQAGGEVTVSNFRDHAWELSVTADGVALEALFGGEREAWLRATVEVRDFDGPEDWQTFPFGHFLVRAEDAERRPYLSRHKLVGRSGEVLAADESFYAGYEAPAGTGVLAECREILEGLGVPPSRIVFPPPGEDKTLAFAYRVDPIQDPAGTRKLRVINALLNSGGFFGLWCDAEGNFRTKKMDERPDRTPDVAYDRRHLVGDIKEESAIDERFGNRIVVQVSDPEAPLIVVAENRDPDSPLSIQRLGRVVQPDPVVVQNTVSLAEAQALAREFVVAAAALGEKLGFDALPDPRRGPKETYELGVLDDSGASVASGLFYPVGFKAPLGLGAWSHEVGRNVRAEDAA